MADRINVAEFFASMGLDAEQLRSEVARVRSDVRRDFEALGADIEQTNKRISTAVNRAVRANDIVGQSEAASAAIGKVIATTVKANGDITKTLDTIGTSQFRVAAGLETTAIKTSALSSALRGLGTSDIEARFQNLTENFNLVNKAFDQGLISQRTFTSAQKGYAQATRELDDYLNGGHIPTLRDLAQTVLSQSQAQQTAAERQALFAKRAVETGNALRSTSYALNQFGNSMTVGVTLPIVGTGIAIAKVTAQLDTMRANFTRSTGSEGLADSLIGNFRQFANSAPIAIDNIAKMTRRIQELRVASIAPQETLRTLGDAVMGLGGGEAEIERVVKAFGDIRAAGKLAGQEVRQLVNANIPAIQILAAELGKTPAQIKAMMREGALDADTTINALLKGLNARFGGEMQNRMNTLTGLFTQFKNEMTFALQDIGKSQLPLMKDLLATATGFVKVVGEGAKYFASLNPQMQKTVVIGLALAAAIGPVSKLFALIIGGAGGAITTIGKVASAIAGVGGITASLSAIPAAAYAGLGLGIAAAAGYALINLGKVNKELDAAFDKQKRWDEWQNSHGRATNADGSVNRRLGQDFANMERWRAREGQDWRPEWAADVAGGNFRIKPVGSPEEEAEKEVLHRQKMLSALSISDTKAQLQELSTTFKSLLPTLNPTQAVEGWKTLEGVMVEAKKQGIITADEFYRRWDDMTNRLTAKGVNLNRINGPRQFLMPDTGMPFVEDEWNRQFREQQKQARAQAREREQQMREYRELMSNPQVGMVSFASSIQKDLNTESLKEFNNWLASVGNDALRAGREVDALFASAGIRNTQAELSKALANEQQALAFLNQGLISANDYNRILVRGYEARLNAGYKLTGAEEKEYLRLIKLTEGAKGYHNALRNIGRQISTIVTDFSRNAIEIFIPRGGEQKDPFSSDVMSSFERAYRSLAQGGYTNPRAALQSTIAQIRAATTAADANRIAIKAFGDMGPVIAQGLRSGQIAGDKLNETLDRVANQLEDTNRKGSKLSQLFGEVGRSILRAFAEQGAQAIADFAGKHLKRLISNLDDILVKIPIIGKGLERIFGIGGNAAGSIPGIPGGQPPSFPGSNGPYGTTIPGWPGGSGGGATSTAGRGASGATGVAMQGALGWVNAAGSVASAVFEGLQYFQQRRMEQDIGRMEVTSRMTFNELYNFRADAWTRQTQLLTKLDDIWRTALNIYDHLGVMSAGGMSLAGAGGGAIHIYINGGEVTGGDPEAVKMLAEGAKLLKRKGYRGRS